MKVKVKIRAVLKNVIDRLRLFVVKQAKNNFWFIWPGLVSGSLGILFGVVSFVFGLTAYLWSGVSLSVVGTALLVLYLAMVFVAAYIAGAHLARLLGLVFVGLLGKNAATWAAVPALVISAALAFSPEGEVEDKRHTEPGGLAFLTSSSVSRLDVDVSLQDMRSTDRLVAVNVKVTAKGDASLAIVGSGPAEFDSATSTAGYVRMAGSEPEQQKAGNLSKRKLPLVVNTFKPIAARDLVQRGDSGMYVARDDTLAPELPGQWFAADTARAFAINLTASPDASYKHEFSFMLRLRSGLSIGLDEGNLGEIGCPNALVSAFEQGGGDASENGLFSLASADLPLTTPSSCSVRVLIAYGSNMLVNMAGQKREIDGFEPLIISAESATSSDTDRFDLTNNLTLSRSDWRLDDRKETSPLEQGWRTIKENLIWAFLGFAVLQLWLALRPWLQRALGTTKQPPA